MADAHSHLAGSVGHQRVKQILADLIRRGAFGANSRLPSDREVMAKLGVSRADVSKAMLELDGDGLIIRRRRRRSYVADEPLGLPSSPLPAADPGEVIALPAVAVPPDIETPPAINGHCHAAAMNGQEPAAPPMTPAEDTRRPFAVDATATSEPPATCGRLVWQRLGRSEAGVATLALIKVHDLADGSRWVEARSLSLDALPQLAAVDFMVAPVAKTLAGHGVSLSQSSQRALLFHGDCALRLLGLRPGEPLLVIDETGVVGGAEVVSGQWVRAVDHRAVRRPPLVMRRPPRRPVAVPAKIADESDLAGRSFSANVVRFGHFLLLVVLALFRR